MATVFFILFFCFIFLMAETDALIPFVPSPNLIDFTNEIIKQCIHNDHFNFTIFPLFMEFLLPFKNANECETFVGLELDFKSNYKNYTEYFKSLFTYHNILKQKFDLQNIASNDIQSLYSLKTKQSDLDATGTEFSNPTPKPLPINETFNKQVDLITKIEANLNAIGALDPQIKTLKENFEHNANYNSNDLHSHFLLNELKHSPELIQKCVKNMAGNEKFIDLSTIVDDTPDLIFKKFVIVICKNYPLEAQFNDAKFWVLSQLFTRL